MQKGLQTMKNVAIQPALMMIDELILTPLEMQIMRAFRRRGRWVANLHRVAVHDGIAPTAIYRYLPRLHRKGMVTPMFRPGRGPGRYRYTIIFLPGGIMDEQTKKLIDALTLALSLIPDWELIDETWPPEVWAIKQRIMAAMQAVPA